MSFQAYLNNIEARTGKTPRDFAKIALKKRLTKHGDIVAWLKSDFKLGHGHANAIARMLLDAGGFATAPGNGPEAARNPSRTGSRSGEGTGKPISRTRFKSVDEYIAAQPEAARPILERVRSSIRKAVPEADEMISYQIPAYKQAGRPVLYFAGWKRHYSLYPVTDEIVAACKIDPASYEVNDKGTIRFPLAEPVPVKLIECIAKRRAKEVGEREKKKTAASPARRSGI